MTPDERQSAALAYDEKTTWGSALHRMVYVLQARGHYEAALDTLETLIEMTYCWREVQYADLDLEEREDKAVLDRLFDRDYENSRNELTAQIRDRR